MDFWRLLLLLLLLLGMRTGMGELLGLLFARADLILEFDGRGAGDGWWGIGGVGERG